MKCPFCGHPEDRVIDSRAGAAGDTIRRRRECEKCERRFTTYERVEYVLPTVVKKDGRREPFDRKKIVQALSIACNKRPVSADQIEGVADAIEREVQDADSREIPSAMLGERVMARLREMDDVAYVRFASVYRSFRDISEFAAELGRLRDDHDGPAVDDAAASAASAAPRAVAPDQVSPVAAAIPPVEPTPPPQPGRRA